MALRLGIYGIARVLATFHCARHNVELSCRGKDGFIIGSLISVMKMNVEQPLNILSRSNISDLNFNFANGKQRRML